MIERERVSNSKYIGEWKKERERERERGRERIGEMQKKVHRKKLRPMRSLDFPDA